MLILRFHIACHGVFDADAMRFLSLSPLPYYAVIADISHDTLTRRYDV